MKLMTFTRSIPVKLVLFLLFLLLVWQSNLTVHRVLLQYSKDRAQHKLNYWALKLLRGEDDPSLLIKFDSLPSETTVENQTYDNVDEYTCKQEYVPGLYDVEDLMCLERPNYLSSYKNPCYLDEDRQLKCVPYFLILGFEKCGTTDLYDRLSQHPSILMNNGDLGKESIYWSWERYGVWRKNGPNYDRGKPLPKRKFQDYPTMFRTAAKVIKESISNYIQPIVGDATPADIWQFRGWPRDPQNAGLDEPEVVIPHVLRHMLSNPKFIVIMREPVERLFSDYIFVRDGLSAVKFDMDVPRAIELMTACLKVNSTRQCFYSDDLHHELPTRLNIGCYSVYIREWLSVFSRKHFLFLRTEDYESDIGGHVQQIYQFLGVSTLAEEQLRKLADIRHVHITASKSLAGVMANSTRQMLRDFYAPCNEDLANLLGDDRFLWKDVPS